MADSLSIAQATAPRNATGLLPAVSIIIPCRNSADTVEACIRSALDQDYGGPIEVCVFDDTSVDGTLDVVGRIESELALRAGGSLAEVAPTKGPRTIKWRCSKDVPTTKPQGPAFARNEAIIGLATGEWICLLDSDDIALPSRVRLQLECALASVQPSMTLVGGGFTRTPEGSTPGYTQWANSLKQGELLLQQWRECTVIQPTWFFHRSLYELIGGWDELPPKFVHGWLLEKRAQYQKQQSEAAAAATGEGSTMPIVTAAWSNATCSIPSSLPRGALLDSPPRKIKRLAVTADSSSAAVEGKEDDEEITTASHSFASFPEDTLFYHRALDAGATLARVNEPVIVYRYSEGSQSWRIPRGLLLQIRVALFEERVLRLRRRKKSGEKPGWRVASPSAASSSSSADASCNQSAGTFTIWGAGRDGKDFFNCLSDEGRALVSCFCDVDTKKIGQLYPQPPSKAEAAKAAAAAGAGVASAAVAEEGAPVLSRRQQKKLAWEAKVKERASGVASGTSAASAEAPSSAIAASTEATISASTANADVDAPPAKRSRLGDGEDEGEGEGAPTGGAAAMPLPPNPPLSSLVAPAPVVSSPYKKIVHFSEIKPPAVICVALGTGGRAEEVRKNVGSVVGLVEGETALFFV
jgi:Glycosyl transferase family 2